MKANAITKSTWDWADKNRGRVLYRVSLDDGRGLCGLTSASENKEAADVTMMDTFDDILGKHLSSELPLDMGFFVGN